MKEKRISLATFIVALLVMAAICVVLIYMIISNKNKDKDNKENSTNQVANSAVVNNKDTNKVDDTNKVEDTDKVEDTNNTETNTFTNSEIKNALQDYLDILGAQEGSPKNVLVKLGLMEYNDEGESIGDNYIKTDIPYAKYKETMLEYMSEELFEEKFHTRFYKESNGMLCYSDVGATGMEYEVESVILKGDYSNLSYIAKVYDVKIDGSKELNNVEFHITNYNGKCVISYSDI